MARGWPGCCGTWRSKSTWPSIASRPASPRNRLSSVSMPPSNPMWQQQSCWPNANCVNRRVIEDREWHAGTWYRRSALAGSASATVLLALQSSDRRVRIEFDHERLRMETEFFRGEGAWTELDEIVIFPGFWVLYLFNGGHVIIPAPQVSEALEAFLRDQAQRVAAP